MVPDGTMVEGVLRSSKLSLFRTRPEKERISKNGTSGEDSAVANSVGVRLMPWLTGHHLPSAIAGSNPRRDFYTRNFRESGAGGEPEGAVSRAGSIGG